MVSNGTHPCALLAAVVVVVEEEEEEAFGLDADAAGHIQPPTGKPVEEMSKLMVMMLISLKRKKTKVK